MRPKGGCNKKWTGRSNTKFSDNIGPTETYYIPNHRKLNENFDPSSIHVVYLPILQLFTMMAIAAASWLFAGI